MAQAEGAAVAPAEPHLHGGCDCDVFHKLEEIVSRPDFIKTLEMTAATCARGGQPGQEEQQQHPPEVAESLWVDAESDLSSSNEYVLVEREDAVESIAYYLAQCILKHPEAQQLAPKQLQEALSTALGSLKQSRFRQLCSYGRYAYRWTALTYSALQMYQNPWLVQAVCTALWTFSRLGMLGLRAFMA